MMTTMNNMSMEPLLKNKLATIPSIGFNDMLGNLEETWKAWSLFWFPVCGNLKYCASRY